MELFIALLVGMTIGALFQIANMGKYEVQINAMRFKDMTIFKFMLSSVIITMFGFYTLSALGIMEFKPKPLFWQDAIFGGVSFGIGWAIFGFCPGTATVALGNGSLDAGIGLLGMLAGATFFSYTYDSILELLPDWGGPGAITLPDLWGINPWILVIGFTIVYLLAFLLFENKKV